MGKSCENLKIKLNSIPKVEFAHAYMTSDYNLSFLKRKSLIEITYMEHSSATFEKEDGTVIYIPSNSIFIHFYDQPSKISSNSYQFHYTIACKVDYTFLEKNSNEIGAINIERVITDEKFVKEASEIIKLGTKKILYLNKSSLELSALMLELFSLYEKRQNTTNEKSKLNPRIIAYVEKAQEYILNNLNKNVSVPDIAEAVGLSSGYLSSIFHKVAGTSIVQYINRVKLEIAKNLVCKESATLAEVSSAIGVSDPNYISRMFRKYMDTSVTQIKYATKNI